MKIAQQAAERHVLNVIVDNEPGILAKITGMFTARGYNIDSLTVADISEDHAISRITIVTRGPEGKALRVAQRLQRARSSGGLLSAAPSQGAADKADPFINEVGVRVHPL